MPFHFHVLVCNLVAPGDGVCGPKCQPLSQIQRHRSCGGAFCYGNEENGHHACMNGHLTTANQSEIRKAYLVSVMATRKMVIMLA